jgi:hypothetical protein
LAIASPSASSSNTIVEITGPKISSRAIDIELSTPSNTVGSTK